MEGGKDMWKKYFRQMLLLLFAVLIVTGCTGKKDAGLESTSGNEASAPAQTEQAAWKPELKMYPLSSIKNSGAADYFTRKKKEVTIGSRNCKAKAVGNKLILSVYDRNNKKIKTIPWNLKAYISEYKKLKIMQVQKIDARKIRVIYGEADDKGSGTSGGAVIVNMDDPKERSRIKYDFWPYIVDDRSAYISAWNKITVMDLNTGEKKKDYRIPDANGTYLNQAYAYKNGKFIYVDQNGIYVSQQGTDDVRKICDWKEYAGRDLSIRDIYMPDENIFYIGFAESEDLPLETVMQVRNPA